MKKMKAMSVIIIFFIMPSLGTSQPTKLFYTASENLEFWPIDGFVFKTKEATRHSSSGIKSTQRQDSYMIAGDSKFGTILLVFVFSTEEDAYICKVWDHEIEKCKNKKGKMYIAEYEKNTFSPNEITVYSKSHKYQIFIGSTTLRATKNGVLMESSLGNLISLNDIDINHLLKNQ